jgi:hypothetical protein
MPGKSKALSERAFRDIVEIAKSSDDPAKLPEMREQAIARITQFKVDASELSSELATFHIGSMRRKLQGPVVSREVPAVATSVFIAALEHLDE